MINIFAYSILNEHQIHIELTCYKLDSPLEILYAMQQTLN